MLIFLLLVTCFPSVVQAQGLAIVQGKVVDGRGKPLAFANVQITDTTDGAITRSDGRFRFATRHLGKRELRATPAGGGVGKRLDLPGERIYL